jgi:hypothetical protein
MDLIPQFQMLAYYHSASLLFLYSIVWTAEVEK